MPKARQHIRYWSEGFTLAEVLITLGIIGVVAAMTIPTLVNKYQKKTLQTQLQKAYSVITNVNTSMIAEGYSPYRDFVTNTITDEIRNEQMDTFAKYLAGAKVCNDRYDKCTVQDTTEDKKYNNLDNSTYAHIDADAYWKKSIITSDGMLIWAGDFTWAKDRYYVDINGYQKGPNQLGHDLFTFLIKPNNTIEPEKGSRCSSTTNNIYLGYGCTYYALHDMNPDDNKKSYWNDFLK